MLLEDFQPSSRGPLWDGHEEGVTELAEATLPGRMGALFFFLRASESPAVKAVISCSLVKGAIKQNRVRG